ncbi:unnamed protein product [Ilex paraguariensis]|uniref:Uncharacterized protein n=1 Tax=Ilex paraguariensis TaxID=185542 RepID=A0ABC8RR93_9AQUA
MATTSSNHPCLYRHLNFPNQRPHYQYHHLLGFSNFRAPNSYGRRTVYSISGEIRGGKRPNTTSSLSTSLWDDQHYEVLPSGKIAYLDEQDVVTFIDPPKELIPLDPSSYNPAAYLWKKIEDISEERRHRLLSLLKPRFLSSLIL